MRGWIPKTILVMNEDKLYKSAAFLWLSSKLGHGEGDETYTPWIWVRREIVSGEDERSVEGEDRYQLP